jgi:hypothetical protein
VYDRRYDGKVLTFEASGGLLNSSLVLQDRETDSYWPIMQGKSLQGELIGTEMKEVAVNRKMTWANWSREHPDTLVLSVDGVEDQKNDYDNYFQSAEGFRDSQAEDKRLETKTPVFAFRLADKPYAVRYSDIVGGRRFELGNKAAYLHRGTADGLQVSTLAYLGSTDSNCAFIEVKDSLLGHECETPLKGFDTFWYNWSLNNPDTELLGQE